MTAPLQLGRIVWAEVADANGNRKVRPAVIITPTDLISPSGSLEVVAVTSRLPQPLPADHLELPWHAQGHPRTHLNRRCAAVCSWVARIAPGNVQSVAGLVPGSLLVELLSRAAAHRTPPVPPPAEPSGGPPDGADHV